MQGRPGANLANCWPNSANAGKFSPIWPNLGQHQHKWLKYLGARSVSSSNCLTKFGPPGRKFGHSLTKPRPMLAEVCPIVVIVLPTSAQYSQRVQGLWEGKYTLGPNTNMRSGTIRATVAVPPRLPYNPPSPSGRRRSRGISTTKRHESTMGEGFAAFRGRMPMPPSAHPIPRTRASRRENGEARSKSRPGVGLGSIWGRPGADPG